KKWPLALFGLLVLASIGLYYGEPLYAKLFFRPEESDFYMEDRPNIVLIVVDALRPDHLGCYGYSRDTSPKIDRVAREAMVFKKGYAQGNWTLVSISTLFSSLYPTSHNVLSGEKSLPKECNTLAEDLKAAGYRTAGFSTNPHIGGCWGGFGLDRGFDYFYNGEPYDFISRLTSTVLGEILDRFSMHTEEGLTAQTLSWIKLHRTQKFFVYLHYMAVHAPYPIPKAYEDIYTKEPIPNRIGDQFDFGHGGVKIEISSAQKKNLIDRYDSAVRFIDDQIGKLSAAIESLGLKEDTLLIITADHGEAFGEHGDWGHGNNLYEETIRVPLIIRYPKICNNQLVSNELAGLIDIKPTILHIAGVPQSELFQGENLISLVRKETDNPHQEVTREELFSEGKEGVKCIITSDNWKLISKEVAGELELYNLEGDPQEKHNVYNLYLPVAKRLKGRLSLRYKEFKKQALEATEASISNQAMRKLKALGYVQ
ncbi:sulfatase, partial [bacterium]|nr:sulfatase [bacterium]